jgi:hypothetical protein
MSGDFSPAQPDCATSEQLTGFLDLGRFTSAILENPSIFLDNVMLSSSDIYATPKETRI